MKKMTKKEALEILKNTLYSDSNLCEAVQVAIKSLEKDVKQDTSNEVIFTGTRVYYELRHLNSNFKFTFDHQKSQDGIRSWFENNRSVTCLPKGKYAIVKVTETEKVEVVEELEE